MAEAKERRANQKQEPVMPFGCHGAESWLTD